MPRVQRVDAGTGEAVPLFDEALMEAAFKAQPGISATQARQIAHRNTYQLNPAEKAVLINFANDLFFYELNSSKAVRLTNNPEEELGEKFSPDARMMSFVRENNLYVLDLESDRERRLTSDGAPKILNGRLHLVHTTRRYV